MESFLLAPVRSFITSRLSAALNQYVSNISIEALGVLGSEIVLNNLELRLEALNPLLDLPPNIKLTRGFVRDLRISIPWTSILSSSIEVRVDGLEVVLSRVSESDSTANEGRSRRSTTENALPVHAPAAAAPAAADTSGLPAWLQLRITRILANVRISLSNVSVRYVHQPWVVGILVRTLQLVSSSGPAHKQGGQGWVPAYAELQGHRATVFKTLAVRDLSVTFSCCAGNRGRVNSAGEQVYSAEQQARGSKQAAALSSPTRGSPMKSSSTLSEAQASVTDGSSRISLPLASSLATPKRSPPALSGVPSGSPQQQRGTPHSSGAPSAAASDSVPERPLLSDCNVLVRMKICLDPDGALSIAQAARGLGAVEEDTTEEADVKTHGTGAATGLSIPDSSGVSPSARGQGSGAHSTGQGTTSGARSSSARWSPLEATAAELHAASLEPGRSLLDRASVSGLFDPFDTALLAAFPGAVRAMHALPSGQRGTEGPAVIEGPSPMAASVSIDAALSQVHVYAEGFDFFLSARQARGLATVLSDLQAVTEQDTPSGSVQAKAARTMGSVDAEQAGSGLIGAGTAETSSVRNHTDAASAAEDATSPIGSSSQQGDANEHNEERAGVLGWLWGAVVGSGDGEEGEAEGRVTIDPETGQEVYMQAATGQRSTGPARTRDRRGSGSAARTAKETAAAAAAHSLIQRVCRAVVVNLHFGSASLTLLKHEPIADTAEAHSTRGSSQLRPGYKEQVKYEGDGKDRPVGGPVRTAVVTASSASAAEMAVRQGLGELESSPLMTAMTSLLTRTVKTTPAESSSAPAASTAAAAGAARPSHDQQQTKEDASQNFFVPDTEDLSSSAHRVADNLPCAERYAAVPFLRFCIGSSWLHTRLLSDIPAPTDSYQEQEGNEDSESAAASAGQDDVCSALQICDLYCDLGAVSVQSWSERSEMSANEARSFSKARMIALQYSAIASLSASAGGRSAGGSIGTSGVGGAYRPPASSLSSVQSGDGNAGTRGRSSSVTSADALQQSSAPSAAASVPGPHVSKPGLPGAGGTETSATASSTGNMTRSPPQARRGTRAGSAAGVTFAMPDPAAGAGDASRVRSRTRGSTGEGCISAIGEEEDLDGEVHAGKEAVYIAIQGGHDDQTPARGENPYFSCTYFPELSASAARDRSTSSGGPAGGGEDYRGPGHGRYRGPSGSSISGLPEGFRSRTATADSVHSGAAGVEAATNEGHDPVSCRLHFSLISGTGFRPVLPSETSSIATTWQAVQLDVQLSSVTASITPSFLGTLVGFMRASTSPASATARAPSRPTPDGPKAAVYHHDAGMQPSALQPLALSFLDSEDGPRQPEKNGLTNLQQEADVEPPARVDAQHCERQGSDQRTMQRRQQAQALPALDLYISCPRFLVFIDQDVGNSVPVTAEVAPVLDIRRTTVHVAASNDSVAMELQRVIRTADQVLSSRYASMRVADSGREGRRGLGDENGGDGVGDMEDLAVIGELSSLYCLPLLRPSLLQAEAGFQGVYIYVQTAAADLSHCGVRHAVTVGDPLLDALLDVTRTMGTAKVSGQLSKVGVYAHMAATAHAELALGAVTLQTADAAVVHCVPLTTSTHGASDDQEACARLHVCAAGMPLVDSPTSAFYAPQLRVSMEVGRGFASVPALQAVAAHCTPLVTLMPGTPEASKTPHEASTADFVVHGQLPVAAAAQTEQADLWSQWLLCCASGSAPVGSEDYCLTLRKAIRDSRTAPLLQLQAEIHSWSVILYDSSASASAALLSVVTPVFMVEPSSTVSDSRSGQPQAGPTHTLEMMGGALLYVPHDVLQAWSDATPTGETHRSETNGHIEREAHNTPGMFSCRPWTPSQLLAAATAQVQLDVVAKISCKALPASAVVGREGVGYGFTCNVDIPSVRGALHETMVGLVLEAAAAVQSALIPVETPTVMLQRHVLASERQAAACQPPAAPPMLLDAHMFVQDLKLDILTLDASSIGPASQRVLDSNFKAGSDPEPAVSGQKEGYTALLTFNVQDFDVTVQGIPLSPEGGQPSASTIQVGAVRVMHVSSHHAISSEPGSPMVKAGVATQTQGITVFECLTLSTQYEAGQAGNEAKLAQQRGERLQVNLDCVCAHLHLPLVTKVVHLSNRVKRLVWWYLTTLYHAQQQRQEQIGDAAVSSSSAESVALLHPYRGPNAGSSTPLAPSQNGSVGYGLGFALPPGTTSGGTPRAIVGSPVAVSVAHFTNTAGPVSVISSDDRGTLCQAVDAAIPCVPYIALCTLPAVSIKAGVCAIKLSHRQGQQHVAYIHAGVREAALNIGESAGDGGSSSARRAVDGRRDSSAAQTGRTEVGLQVTGVTLSAGVAQTLAAVEAFPDDADPSIEVFASVGPTDLSASATLNTNYLPAAKRLELDSAFAASITRIDGTGSVSGLMTCSQTMLPALLGLSGDAVVLAAAPGEQPTETAKRIIRAASPASKTSMDDLAVHSKVTYEALFPGLSLAFHFVERALSHRSNGPSSNEYGQVALDVDEARIRGSRDLQLSPGFVVQNADVMPTWSRVTGNGHAYLTFLTITHTAGIPAAQLGHGPSYRHHHASRHAGHAFKVAPLVACVQAADSPWLSVDWKESGVPSTTSASNSAAHGPAQRTHSRMRSSNSSSAFPSSIDPPIERRPRSQALWPVLDMTVQLQRVKVQLDMPAVQSLVHATVSQNEGQKVNEFNATSKSSRAPSILPPEWFVQPAQPQLVYASTLHRADAPIRHLVRFRVVCEGVEASLATATAHTPECTADRTSASIVIGASQCYSAFGFILGEEMFATAPTADHLMLYEHSTASTEASRLLTCDVGHVEDQFVLGGTLSFYRAYASIRTTLPASADEGRGDRAAPLLLPCDISLTALTRSYTPLHAASGTAGIGVPVRSMTTMLCELPPVTVELTRTTMSGLICLSSQLTQLQAAVAASAPPAEHIHASSTFDTHTGLVDAEGDIPARSNARTIDIVHKLATLSVTQASASHRTMGTDLDSPACAFGTSAFPLDALLLAGIDINAVCQQHSPSTRGALGSASDASLLIWDTLDVSDDGSVLGCFEWSYPQPVIVSRVSASAPVAVPASAGAVVSAILRRQETADITCVLECRQGSKGKWKQRSTFTVPFTTGAQYAHSGAVQGGAVSTSVASPMKRSGAEMGATPHKQWHSSHAAPEYELLDYVTSYAIADRAASCADDKDDESQVEHCALPLVAAATCAAQAASTQWRVRPIFVPAQTSRGMQPQLQSTAGYSSLCIAVASVLRVHLAAAAVPDLSAVRRDSRSASPLGLFPTIHTTLCARDLTVALYTGRDEHGRKDRVPLLSLHLIDSTITSCTFGTETLQSPMHSEEASGGAIQGLQHTAIRLPQIGVSANRPRDGHRYPLLSASSISINLSVVQSTALHCQPVTLQTDLNVGDVVAQVHLPLIQDVLAATSSLADLVGRSVSGTEQTVGDGSSRLVRGPDPADGHLRVQNRCHIPLVLCSVRPAAKLVQAEGTAVAADASATDQTSSTTAVSGTFLQFEAVGTVEAGSSAQLQVSGPPVHAFALSPLPSICRGPVGSVDSAAAPVPVVPTLNSTSTTTPVLYDESGMLPAQVSRHLQLGHGLLRHVTVSTHARRVPRQQSPPSSSMPAAVHEAGSSAMATDFGDMETVEYKTLLGMAVDGLQGTVTITPPITFSSVLDGNVVLQWRAVHTIASSVHVPTPSSAASELDRTRIGGVSAPNDPQGVTGQKSTSVLGSVWGWLSGRVDEDQHALVDDGIQQPHSQQRDIRASRHTLLTDGVPPARQYLLEGSMPLPFAPHGSVCAGPLLPTAVTTSGGAPSPTAEDCTFSLSFTASGCATRYVSVDLTFSSLRTALNGKQAACLIVPFSSSALAPTLAAEIAHAETTHDILLRLQRDVSPQAILCADGQSELSFRQEPLFLHVELLPCVRSNLVDHTEVRRGTSGTEISACWPFNPASLRLAALGAAGSDMYNPGRLRYAVSSTSSGGSTPSVAGLASLDAYASALAHIVKVQTSITLPSVWSFDADTRNASRIAKWTGPSDTPWLLVHAGWVKTLSTDGRAFLEPVERPTNDESSTDAVVLIRACAPQEHTAPHVDGIAPLQIVNCLSHSLQVGYSTVALPEVAAKAMGTTSSMGMEIAAQGMSESAALPVLFQSMQGGAPSLCLQLRATASTTPEGLQVQGPAGITVFLPLPAGPGLDQASWIHSQLLLPSADANAADVCLPVSLSCHVPTGTPYGLLPQLVVTVRPRAVVKVSRMLSGLVGTVSSYDESSGCSVLSTAAGAGTSEPQHSKDDEYTILAPRTIMALVQDPPVAVCLSSHGVLRFRLLDGPTTLPRGSAGTTSAASRHAFLGAQGQTEVRQPAYRRGLTSSAVVHDLDIIGKALSWPSIPAGHAVRLTLSAPCGLGLGPTLPVLCRADVAFDSSTGVTVMTISAEERPPVVLQTRSMTSVSYPVPVACNPGHMSAWMHAYCSPWERVAVLSGLVRQLEASLRAASALRTAVPAANAGTSKSASTSGNRTPALASSGQAQSAGPLAADLAACEVALAYAKGGLLEDVELAEDSLRLWHEEEAEEGQEQPPHNNHAAGEASSVEGHNNLGYSKQAWQAKGKPSALTVHPLLRLRRAAWRREPMSVQLPASSTVPFDWLLLVDTGLPFEGSPHLRTRYTGSLMPARSAEGQRPGLASIRWVPAFPTAWSAPAPAARATIATGPATSAVGTSTASTSLMSPKAKGIQVVDIRASDLDILHVPAQTAQDRMHRLQEAAATWRHSCATGGHRSARMSTVNGEDEDEQTLQQQYPTIVALGTPLRLVPGPAGAQHQHGNLSVTGGESTAGAPPVILCPFVNGSVLVPLREVHALGRGPGCSAHSPSVRTSIHIKHASGSLLWPQVGQLVRGVHSTPGAQVNSALAVDHLPGSALRELCVAHLTVAHVRVDEGEGGGWGQRIVAGIQGFQIDDHGNASAFTVPLSMGSPGADTRARCILAAWMDEDSGAFPSSSLSSRIAGTDARARPSDLTADDLRALALSMKASFMAPPSPSYAPLRRPSPVASSLRDLYLCPGLVRVHVSQGVLEQYAGVLRAWPATLAKTVSRLQEAIAGTSAPPVSGSGSSASQVSHMFTSSSLVVERLYAEVTLRLGESPAVSQGAGVHAVAVSAANTDPVGFMHQTGLQHADIAADSDNPLSGLTSPLYLAVDRMHIGLSGVALDRPLCSLPRLGRELVASAVTDLLLSSPAVLGSLDIVGNPTRLVRSLVTGVAELVLQPTRAVWGADAARTGTGDRRTDRPVVLGVLLGLATGARSFASHVGEGALTSIAGFTTSLARNLELLMAEEVYEETVPVTNQGSVSTQGTSAVVGGGTGGTAGSTGAGGQAESTEKPLQQAIVLQGALLLVPAPPISQTGDGADATTAPAVRVGIVVQPAWWSHEVPLEKRSTGLDSSVLSPHAAAQQRSGGIVSIVQNLDAFMLLDGLASGLVGVVVHPLAGALDLVGRGSAGLAAALQGKDGEIGQYRPAKTIMLGQQ